MFDDDDDVCRLVSWLGDDVVEEELVEDMDLGRNLDKMNTRIRKENVMVASNLRKNISRWSCLFR